MSDVLIGTPPEAPFSARELGAMDSMATKWSDHSYPIVANILGEAVLKLTAEVRRLQDILVAEGYDEQWVKQGVG